MKTRNNISNDTIQRIKTETDIVELVSDYIALERKGKNYFGTCPWHEDNTPSFTVSPDNNTFMCQSCKRGGDSIDFLMNIENIQFREASKILADKLDIKLNLKTKNVPEVDRRTYEALEHISSFYQMNLKHSREANKAIQYLEGRGIDMDLIKEFKIGFSPNDAFTTAKAMMEIHNYTKDELMTTGVFKEGPTGLYDIFTGRVIFPVDNIDGQTVSFNGRAIDKAVKEKYINGPQTKVFKKSDTIYRFLEARRDVGMEREVILHEGAFDVIATYKAGRKNVVASMGTSLTTGQAKVLRRMTDSVLLVFDGDDAGAVAMDRSIKILQSEGLRVDLVLLTDGLDPDEFIKKFGVEKYLDEMSQNRMDGFTYSFNFHSKDIDLKNVNDLIKFNENFYSTLENENDFVKEFFRNKIFEKFNMDLSYSDARYIQMESMTVKEVSNIALNEIIRSGDNIGILNNIDFEFLDSEEPEISKWIKFIMIERNKNGGNFNFDSFRKRMTLIEDKSFLESFDKIIDSNVYYRFNIRFENDLNMLINRYLRKKETY